MEPTSFTATATASSAVPTFGFDIFGFILQLFGGGETTAALLSGNGIASFLSSVWSVYVFVALILSVIMLGLYAYASMWRWYYYGQNDKALRDAEQLYDAQFRGIRGNSRMDDILEHVASDNPNDWKLAIIEADIILDGLLKERGYAGNTLGERLKSIGPQQMDSLNDAWEAHKIRNMIAHEGPDFVLTKRMVQDTINRYQRVFREFGLI